MSAARLLRKLAELIDRNKFPEADAVKVLNSNLWLRLDSGEYRYQDAAVLRDDGGVMGFAVEKVSGAFVKEPEPEVEPEAPLKRVWKPTPVEDKKRTDD